MKVTQLSLLVLITTVVLAELAAGNEWEQVLRAGMIDRATGCPIRGTEIVHLVTHRGRLYAGNGYWMDTRGYANIPWAQVIYLKEMFRMHSLIWYLLSQNKIFSY